MDGKQTLERRFTIIFEVGMLMKKFIFKCSCYIVIFSFLNLFLICIANVFLYKDSVDFPNKVTLLDIVDNKRYSSAEDFSLCDWKKDEDVQNNYVPITDLPSEVLNCEFTKCTKLESTIIELLETKYTSKLCCSNIRDMDLSEYVGVLNIVFVEILDRDYILITFWEMSSSKSDISLNVVAYKSAEKIHKFIEPYSSKDKDGYVYIFLPNTLYTYNMKYYPCVSLCIGMVLLTETLFIAKKIKKR